MAKPAGDYENVVHVSYDGQPLSPGASDAYFFRKNPPPDFSNMSSSTLSTTSRTAPETGPPMGVPES